MVRRDKDRIYQRICCRCDRLFRGSRKATVCSKCVIGNGVSSEVL